MVSLDALNRSHSSPARADRARSGLEKQKTGNHCGVPGPVGMCGDTDRNCAGRFIPPLAFRVNPTSRLSFPQPDGHDHFSWMSGRAFARNGLCEPQKSVSGLRTGQTINAMNAGVSRFVEAAGDWATIRSVWIIRSKAYPEVPRAQSGRVAESGLWRKGWSFSGR